MNLNFNTFIGMSQLRNEWYIFDQYKTTDNEQMFVCFVMLSIPKPSCMHALIQRSDLLRSRCGFGNIINVDPFM